MLDVAGVLKRERELSTPQIKEQVAAFNALSIEDRLELLFYQAMAHATMQFNIRRVMNDHFNHND